MNTVNIRRLRELVLTRLPAQSPLRRILGREGDELSYEEFLAKFPIWWELTAHEEATPASPLARHS